MIRAVLFDLDGTLVDSAHLWRAALGSLVVRRDGTRPPVQVMDGLTGLTTREAVSIIRGRLGWSVRDPELDARQIDEDTDWVECSVGETYLQRVVWRDGALGLLAAIRAVGVATGLVTSSGRGVVEALLSHRGGPVFDVVVCGSDVASAKPHPEPYLTAADRLGVLPGECVAIEDSTPGLRSALAAGCGVVAVGPEADCADAKRCVKVELLTEITLDDILLL
jgi:HAD superfamily hydrolase (TIGR01509 family)